jgi:hypothetical protein
MTEQEYLVSENILQLLGLVERRYPHSLNEAPSIFAADRKLRLFAVGCGRLPPVVLTDPRLIRAIEGVEDFADGEAGWENHSSVDLEQFEREVNVAFREFTGKDAEQEVAALITMSCIGTSGGAAAAAEYAARHYCSMTDENGFNTPHNPDVADLLRDIFGNLFRKVKFNRRWRTDTAVTLARQMYDAREFSAMPILADALQDAGCDNEAILSHCRDAALTHVRGCWVTDLVLNKS